MASPVMMMPLKPILMKPGKPKTTEETPFLWDRNKSLALATERCSKCMGYGLTAARRGEKTPDACSCVLRKAFRTCYRKYREIQSNAASMSQVRMDRVGTKEGRFIFGRKQQEFSADFYLIARRVLANEPRDWRIFTLHFLYGLTWSACCKELWMDRGNFFHDVYRIQKQLGRAFCETQPYAIYPLDEYFGGAIARDGKADVSVKIGNRDHSRQKDRLLPPLTPLRLPEAA